MADQVLPGAATAQRAPKDRLKRNRMAGLVLAFLVFVFDQATKWVVTYPLNLENQPERTIRLTSFFNLTWTENYGVSMGFLNARTAGAQWLLIGLTAAIATFVAVWMWREKRRDDALALSMVLGGALGNIVD